MQDVDQNQGIDIEVPKPIEFPPPAPETLPPQQPPVPQTEPVVPIPDVRAEPPPPLARLAGS